MGQEFVARTHHRGVIRKRLLPFKIVDETGAGKYPPSEAPELDDDARAFSFH